MKKMPLRKSHSWWWDSHISPKNSRWLSENLEQMDGVVKEMLKLVEEDGETFAKKADMYYQRRPELISRVEEFYRMYRALAERYDMASGELRRNTPSDLQSQASSISSSDFVLEPASPSFSLSSDITPGRKSLKTESSSEFGSDTEGGEEKEAAAERLRALENRVRELEAEQMQARSALVECTLERANLKKEIVEERKKSVELRKEVERQRALVLDGEEGKREAIRQLCFSLDHYRDAYHKLRQLLLAYHPPTKSPAACALDSGKKHSYIGWFT